METNHTLKAKEEVKRLLDNIREIRDSKKLNQENMANSLGIDTSTYSKIENGKIELTANRLSELASIFQMKIIDLLTWPDKLNINSTNGKPNNVKAILQIELEQEKKDQVIKLVFGENILEILNK